MGVGQRAGISGLVAHVFGMNYLGEGPARRWVQKRWKPPRHLKR